jgi:Undecaprenyl-phosphate galactose phosphotransferase WbaP
MTTAAWALQTFPRARRTCALHVAVLLAADASSIFLAGAVAVLTRWALGGHLDLFFYLRMSAVTGIFLLTYATVGLYPAIVVHPVTELSGIVRATTLTVLLLATMSFFQRDVEAYSRAVLLGSWLLIIVFVRLGRALTRGCLARTDWWGELAVVIGAGRAGRQVADTLARNPGAGLRVLAILDDDSDQLELAHGAAPVTAPLSAAVSLAEDYRIRYAIIAMPEARGAALAQIVERYASRFHHVFIIPDLSGISSLSVDARDLGGVLGVKVSHRLLHRAPQAAKRTLDLLAAVLGGLLLLPVFALLAALIRLTSAGPVFYAHDRIGRDGRRFRAWKFRTMVRDADDVLRRHLRMNPELRAEWIRDQKLRDDPRVTTVGKLLRRTSMDELPQIWNVILGDMSFVGPRPIVQAEVERYGLRYSLYKKVRPGLTGLWQVSGRNNTTYDERVAFDEYYVRNWSVWLDLHILAETVKVVLTGDGAY